MAILREQGVNGQIEMAAAFHRAGFEARAVLLHVNASASPWLAGMAGALLPTPVVHGEGRAEFNLDASFETSIETGTSPFNTPTSKASRPNAIQNPNSAEQGLAGVTAANGRVLAAMPHPERVFRAIQNSWRHERWQEAGPWLRLFRNARVALG